MPADLSTEAWMLDNKIIPRVLGLCAACMEPCSRAHGGLSFADLCVCCEDDEAYRKEQDDVG